MKHQTAALISSSAVHVSGSVTIYLLGINTEFTDFQQNFTVLKLVSDLKKLKQHNVIYEYVNVTYWR